MVKSIFIYSEEEDGFRDSQPEPTLRRDFRDALDQKFFRVRVGFLVGPKAVKAFRYVSRVAGRQAAQLIVKSRALRQELA